MVVRRPTGSVTGGPVHPISVLEQVHGGPLCSSVFTFRRGLDGDVKLLVVISVSSDQC